MNKLTYYDELVKKFANKKCKLLTTYEDYSKINDRYKKVNIIGICGHNIDNVYIHTFFNRDSGSRCKDCIKKDQIRLLKSKPLKSSDTAFLSEQIFKKYLPDFDIEKTHEGCLVDLIIRPKNKLLYLPIQLKSTLETIFNCYSFNKISKNKYKDMIIVFICINEELFWVLENKDVDVKSKINIGNNSDKYGKFQINKTSLNEKFINLYNINKNILNTKEFFNVPINIYQKREYEYKQLRISKVNFIKFVEPLIDSQVYDFLIGTKKVQEKVCGIRKGRNQYICHLIKNSKTISKDNIKKTHTNYELGDNDFYWINLPDKNTFYVFPEKILYIMDKINTNKLITLNIPYDDTYHWTYKYKFYYNTINNVSQSIKLLGILNATYIIKNKVDNNDMTTNVLILVEQLSRYV
jgi:hypothetical protein